jgi:RNA polymerase sigma-70 factor (ECF subfamily)
MPKFEGKGDFEILDFMTDDDLNAERQIIKSQIETDLHELIKELPQDQLEVLEMRIFKEMSFKEIAFKTDVSINTALGRMRYALINLRKIIEKHQVVLTN